MALYYFKCNNCDYMFLTGTSFDSKTLICGEGCGGKLKSITEEEAQAEVENMHEQRTRDSYYS